MNRLRIGVLCLMMVFIFGISMEVAGQNKGESEQALEDMCIPMGKILLKPDALVKQKRSQVEFDHSKHLVNDCKACHHTWEGNAKIVTCATSGCHDLLKSPRKPTKYLSYTDTGIKYYKYAFHQQCVGCHKEIKIKRKEMEMSYRILTTVLPKTGPTGCIECHPKE
jgi:hypothetical protein